MAPRTKTSSPISHPVANLLRELVVGIKGEVGARIHLVPSLRCLFDPLTLGFLPRPDNLPEVTKNSFVVVHHETGKWGACTIQFITMYHVLTLGYTKNPRPNHWMPYKMGNPHTNEKGHAIPYDFCAENFPRFYTYMHTGTRLLRAKGMQPDEDISSPEMARTPSTIYLAWVQAYAFGQKPTVNDHVVDGVSWNEWRQSKFGPDHPAPAYASFVKLVPEPISSSLIVPLTPTDTPESRGFTEEEISELEIAVEGYYSLHDQARFISSIIADAFTGEELDELAVASRVYYDEMTTCAHTSDACTCVINSMAVESDDDLTLVPEHTFSFGDFTPGELDGLALDFNVPVC